MRSPFVDLLADLAPVLDGFACGWYLFGAQAALIHGARRLTADVDVTVHLRERSPTDLVHHLERAGFQMRVEGDDFVEQTRVLPLVHKASGVALDVVLAGPGLEELFLQRARDYDVGGVTVPVACAEDIVVMKVLAGRAKDEDDVCTILAAHPADLDIHLIRNTLRLIEQALDQGDLLPAFDRFVKKVQSKQVQSGDATIKTTKGKRRKPKAG